MKCLKKARLARLLIGAIFIVLFIVQHKTIDAGSSKLTVTFLNVKQGDAALLESDGKTMLIDGGPTAEGNTVVEYLKAKGINKLDYMIATHDHADHIGGLISVCKEIEVGKIYRTRQPYIDATSTTFNHIIMTKNIAQVYPSMGSTIQFGSATITFIAPNSSGYSSYNDNSLVVRIVNGRNSFLFTGDAEFQSESEMIQKGYELKSDVLKVGHHSALTSSSDAFIQAVDPSISIISCDEKHQAGFPRITTLRKLTDSNIYRTDISGNIEMVSDGFTITTEAIPYSYAKYGIDVVTGKVTSTNAKESKNLSKLSATSMSGEITLNKMSADEDYDPIYKSPLTIYFQADCGISSIESIEYFLAEAGVVYNLNQIEWTKLDYRYVTLANDFVGCIYVKFVNQLGNVVIRKTNGFTLDVKAPTNCKVESTVSGLNLVEVDEKNSYSRYGYEPVHLKFLADFGVSEEEKTEYMLVNRGAGFNENREWTEGNEVTIEDTFIGRVYVRFTDGAGHEKIVKTTGFTWIEGSPINTKVVTRKTEITYIGFSEESPESIEVKNKLTLGFKADFGYGGKKSIRYKAVAVGENYKTSGKWITGSSAVLKKGFEGCVYVRYTDKAGHTVTRKTNNFKII
ncbi:ComEC/Rec2 family competence protein [Anaeromicropila populeti]|nr:MBL fold metallo-hydrolase [Anaeromicropila populeti]